MVSIYSLDGGALPPSPVDAGTPAPVDVITLAPIDASTPTPVGGGSYELLGCFADNQADVNDQNIRIMSLSISSDEMTTEVS